ncbi:FAD-binding protein [Paraburkholderia sp. CNPSo 3274]|uniref:FAD-binding protein n=1 Tax=unclassified Paraburkholderia TaxID=2615204 RepID=UPI0020B65E71|nr:MULTISPECIES: FAD-binding protein [unclassified Paraburkholderia]MCP3710517.1 FAD-binding protein [Paraburkholderia sp. CNPSo 3274]MCP3715312.1 FAD-binding protein [Paraburkholderia sp. CNPSo 3281]
MSGTWDASYDFVVVGSGGGSMCAALACKSVGKDALIIEKLPKVGGSTGYSGGVWWLPNNHVMKRHGVSDSYERARQYFDAAVTYQGPGTSEARREAYLRTGPKMAEFLEQQGMQFVYADGWSDYYDTLPGGEPRGRSLLAKLFDVKELGEWAPRLSRYKGPSMPANSDEYPELFLMKRTWGGKRKAMQLGGRMLYQKITGKELVANGAAIQGRMLQMALRANVPIWTDTPVRELIVEDGRVTGIVAVRSGREMRIQAREGVLLNTGGFSHNAEMRRKYQPQPSSADWTNANPGDTGEILQAAIALGGAVDCMEEAWWVVTSLGPNEELPEGARAPDGSPLPFMHHLDLSLPFSIMVDQDGERFCDEAGAYMEIGQRMYQRHKDTGKAVPAWVVMDSRQRRYYPWGTAMPGQIPQKWLDSGYMIKADTLEELAAKCNIDRAGLLETVKRFNGFCETGVDEDYGRGSRAFDRCHGDPTIKPNPNLGPIEEGPFYAVRMYPGDVGTAGGLVTDEYARVLRDDGSQISGLYATGNCTASVVGRCYPGAGSSIGASFVFGYIAALHASGAQKIW